LEFVDYWILGYLGILIYILWAFLGMWEYRENGIFECGI